MDTRTVLVSAGLLLVAVTAAMYANTRNIGTFEDDNLMNRGLNTPAIWIYVDDTDVNSRWWADFGARSSRVYNMPFLNLCYQSIVKAAGQRYHVEVISGIGDAESRLGGLPVGMSRKKLPLRDEEMTYLKVAFLEKFGGLWLGPATICIRDIPELPKEQLAFIGSDPLETYAGSKGTFIPNQMPCGLLGLTIRPLSSGVLLSLIVLTVKRVAKKSVMTKCGIYSLIQQAIRIFK